MAQKFSRATFGGRTHRAYAYVKIQMIGSVREILWEKRWRREEFDIEEALVKGKSNLTGYRS